MVNKGSYKASDIIEMHETFPDIGEGKKKAQHIHSHHSMKTFFSPTDWENLEDRARASNYVLMLIVNFDGNYKAKVAFLAKEDNKKGSRLSFVNNVDGYKPISLSGSSDKDVLAVMDCKVILEEEVVGEAFKARFNAVIETKLSEEKSKPKSKPHSEPTYSKQGKLYRDDWSYDGGGKKKISDMTDTDWRKFEDIAATEVFGFPHVKALLNSMLDGTYIPGDFTDPIKKIEKEWRDMGRESEKEEWVAEFGDELSEHFDTLFPYRELHQYVQFLEMMMEFLRPYRYSKAIEKIMEEVQLEIDTNKKPIILPYEAGN